MRRPIFEHFAFEPWLQQLKVSEVLLDLFRASFFCHSGVLQPLHVYVAD
jgi:hypothetical protein